MRGVYSRPLYTDSKGNSHSLAGWALKSGLSEATIRYRLKIGMTLDEAISKPKPDGRSRTPEYRTWHGMMHRCNNPSSISFPRYGGRGIEVCDRWHSFENFLNDMGTRPIGLTLDRIDSSKGYSKENCRWATCQEQSNNMSNNRKLTLNGNTKTFTEWARLYEIDRRTLNSRLKRGWTVSEALMTPLGDSPFQKNFKKRKLTDIQIREILELRQKGEMVKSIASKYDVSSSLVSTICTKGNAIQG